MEPSTNLKSDVPELAWIVALTAEGKYVAAAEAAERAFHAASDTQKFAVLCLWEDLAFAMRPAGVPTPHPSVAGVVPALRELTAAQIFAPAQQAVLLARLGRQVSWPDPTQPIPAVREAVSLARASGNQAALLFTLAALHVTLDSPRHLPERLSLSSEMVSLAATEPSAASRAWAHWRREIDCLVAADPAAYDHHIEVFVQIAGESRDRFLMSMATVASATRELLHGNYDRAEALLPALAEAAKSPGGLAPTTMSSVGLLARFQRGRGSAEGLSRMFSGVRAAHVAFRVGLAYYLATSGRPTEAAAEFGPVNPSALPDDAGRVPCLCMAIELACIYFDDKDLAAASYDLLLPHAGQMAVTGETLNCLGPVDLYLGIAAQFLGRDGFVEHLERARNISASFRARPWLARSLLLLGVAEQEASGSGTRKIEEALAIAERIEFPAIAAAARAALRDGLRPTALTSPGSLTAREREVLGLVATGLTAVEIAQKLVLSPRTVEKHIEHAYAKIGARNRAEGITWAIVNGLTEDA